MTAAAPPDHAGASAGDPALHGPSRACCAGEGGGVWGAVLGWGVEGSWV